MNYSLPGSGSSPRYSMNRMMNASKAEPRPAPSGGRGEDNLERDPTPSGGLCHMRLCGLVPYNGKTLHSIKCPEADSEQKSVHPDTVTTKRCETPDSVINSETASGQKPVHSTTVTTKRCEKVDFGLQTAWHRRFTDLHPTPEALHHVLLHMREHPIKIFPERYGDGSP